MAADWIVPALGSHAKLKDVAADDEEVDATRFGLAEEDTTYWPDVVTILYVPEGFAFVAEHIDPPAVFGRVEIK